MTKTTDIYDKIHNFNSNVNNNNNNNGKYILPLSGISWWCLHTAITCELSEAAAPRIAYEKKKWQPR